jgi:hypothetical protein
MFNVDQFLNRDYDYYLFWADEIFSEVWNFVFDCKNEKQVQIRITHWLMDQGQEKFYQEDGFILGSIIWESVKAELKKVDCYQ